MAKKITNQIDKAAHREALVAAMPNGEAKNFLHSDVQTAGGKTYHSYHHVKLMASDFRLSTTKDEATGDIVFTEMIIVSITEWPRYKSLGFYSNKYGAFANVLVDGVPTTKFVSVPKGAGATHHQIYGGDAYYVPYGNLGTLDFTKRRPIPGNNLKNLKLLLEQPKPLKQPKLPKLPPVVVDETTTAELPPVEAEQPPVAAEQLPIAVSEPIDSEPTDVELIAIEADEDLLDISLDKLLDSLSIATDREAMLADD